MSIITETTLSTIEDSADRVQAWVEAANYQGYEPFDGLSSWFRPLTFGTLLGDRLLMQLIRQSPVNLRPLMGVKPKDSTKGRGYMAWGYLFRYRATGDAEFLKKAEENLDWLDHHKVPRFEGHSWSNHFDFAGRGGMYTSDEPIIVWTSHIGHAYLEAFEQTGNERWLKIAESVCSWIMDLPREKTENGSCLSYLADRQSSIHNSSMLGAAVLARTAKHNGNQELQDVARSAMEYSCTRQLDDGAWWYGEEEKYHWIDNFHSGYNLDSLKYYIDYSGDTEWESKLDLGLDYLMNNFFENDGCPKYYHDRKFPVDSQCAGQAIETLATFSSRKPECLELAVKVANWTIENLQDPKGYFYYRVYPLVKAKTPMLHWAQGTIFKGLSVLSGKLRDEAVLESSKLAAENSNGQLV